MGQDFGEFDARPRSKPPDKRETAVIKCSSCGFDIPSSYFKEDDLIEILRRNIDIMITCPNCNKQTTLTVVSKK